MNHLRRAVLSAATAGALALGAAAVAAPTALAAPTCDGGSCNHLDPMSTYSSIDGYRCDSGAYTVASASTSQGLVELRYGPHCHANWARISSSSPGTAFWVRNSYGDYDQYTVPAGYTSAWNNMVNGYPPAEAGDASGNTGWH